MRRQLSLLLVRRTVERVLPQYFAQFREAGEYHRKGNSSHNGRVVKLMSTSHSPKDRRSSLQDYFAEIQLQHYEFRKRDNVSTWVKAHATAIGPQPVRQCRKALLPTNQQADCRRQKTPATHQSLCKRTDYPYGKCHRGRYQNLIIRKVWRARKLRRP